MLSSLVVIIVRLFGHACVTIHVGVVVALAGLFYAVKVILVIVMIIVIIVHATLLVLPPLLRHQRILLGGVLPHQHVILTDSVIVPVHE